jgi:cation:H+ antiporter
VLSEFLLIRGLLELPISDYQLLLAFAGVYILLGTALFVGRRKALGNIVRDSAGTVNDAFSSNGEPQGAD